MNVDAIVFVVDSQWEVINTNLEIRSLLEETLHATTDKRIDDVPLVIQYNKRDVTNALSIEELESKLNSAPLRRPYVEAIAQRGDGVFDTLRAVARLLSSG